MSDTYGSVQDIWQLKDDKQDIINLSEESEELNKISTSQIMEDSQNKQDINANAQANQSMSEFVQQINDFNTKEELVPKTKVQIKAEQKAIKQAEKKAAEDAYLDAIKFDSKYADPRSTDSDAMAAIRSAMKEYFDYKGDKNKLDDEEDISKREGLHDKLKDIESKCNSYLRFKICFSKAAKKRTADVKALRQKVREEITKYNDVGEQYEHRTSNVVKNFFTDRIPNGFKSLGRSIKKPFTNTFSNRTAGQVTKEFLRDHIWGGIFRNAFNTVAMGVALPFWLIAWGLKGGAKLINKVSGDRVFRNTHIETKWLPTPHLPSTWTRHYQEMSREKERKLKKKEDPNILDDTFSKNFIIYNNDDDRGASTLMFRLFGWNAYLDKKGTSSPSPGDMGAESKEARKMVNDLPQSKEAINKRAEEDYNMAVRLFKEDSEDDDD